MRKIADLFIFVILASTASACALDPEDNQPDESDVSSQLLTSCKSVFTNNGSTLAATACFNDGGSGAPSLAVKDEKCDGHSVYATYQVNNGSVVRLENSAGCGNIVAVTFSNTSFNIAYKICVDIQFSGDPCSATVFDHHTP